MKNVVNDNKMDYKGSKVSYYEKDEQKLPFISHFEIDENKINVYYDGCKKPFPIEYTPTNMHLVLNNMKQQVSFLCDKYNNIQKRNNNLDLAINIIMIAGLASFISLVLNVLMKKYNLAVPSLILFYGIVVVKGSLEVYQDNLNDSEKEILKYKNYIENEDLIKELYPRISINDLDNYSYYQIANMILTLKLFKENEDLINEEIMNQYYNFYGPRAKLRDVNKMTVEDLNNYSLSDLVEMIENIKKSNELKLQLNK